MEIFSFRVVRQSTVKKTRHKSVEKVERRRSKAEQSPPPGSTALIWTSLKCDVCNRVEASLRAQGHLREGLMDRTHWMRCPHLTHFSWRPQHTAALVSVWWTPCILFSEVYGSILLLKRGERLMSRCCPVCRLHGGQSEAASYLEWDVIIRIFNVRN